MALHSHLARVLMAEALLGTFVALASVACGTRESPPRVPSASVAAYPHATDRLYRLYRRQLTDSNPFPTEQAIACERRRIRIALGSDEGWARTTAVFDTVFRTPADRAAHERAQARLTNAVVYLGGEVCDSLDAVAQRELPLPVAKPPDSAAPRR